jgi:hypothetical protein
MSDKNAKRPASKRRASKPAKGGAEGKSVMGNLPSTRPTRMARRRDGEPAANGTAAETTASAPAARAPRATAKKARATAAAKKDERRATATAKPRAKADAPRADATRAKAEGPRAVRSGSPSLAAAKERKRPRRQPPSSPPKGTELVTTAVQAAGELAQIGLTLGGQAIKRAVDRLPKP